METSNAFPQSLRRWVLFILLGSLALLLFAATVYRVENPSLVQQETTQASGGAMGGMNNMDGMGEIMELMQQLKADPDNVETIRKAALAFMDMHAWERSLNLWNMLLEKKPDDSMARHQKGFCLFQMDRHEEVAAVFESLLQSDPSDQHVRFNLAVLYSRYLSQDDRAKALLQEILTAAPDDPELLQKVREELEHVQGHQGPN